MWPATRAGEALKWGGGKAPPVRASGAAARRIKYDGYVLVVRFSALGPFSGGNLLCLEYLATYQLFLKEGGNTSS